MIRKAMLFTVALAMGGCLMGCSILLDGNGEFGFKQSTSWGFYHETEKNDADDNSKAELEAQAILDYVLPDKDATAPTGAGTD